MAALIASRRAHVSRLLEKLAFSPLRPLSAAPSIARSFNTNAQFREYCDAQLREYGDDDHEDCRRHDDEDAALNRHHGGAVTSFPGFFSDVFDPFNSTRTLSQVLNTVDQMLDNPFTSVSRAGFRNLRRGWDAKEDNDALYLWVDMPGVGKEHVQVRAEKNTLVIKGESEKERSSDGEAGRKYGGRIDLPSEYYKMDQIKAELKNGVLKVVVPKAKAEERKDVFEIKIQ